MAYAMTNRTFVYGDFFFSKKRPGLPPVMQPFAIEILREFSTTELIGKLYVRAAGTWSVAARGALANFEWYSFSQKVGPSAASRFLYFVMEGSGVWQVQHLRDESDDSGPYIAVALKFSPDVKI
jgi:hypothetical protein